MPIAAQVLIAGAGPTGLVAALSLLRNGVTVRVVEKADGPRPGQRGAGNMPRTLETYHFLDVPELIEKGTLPPLMQAHTYGSADILEEFSMVPVFDETPACPFNNSLAIGQCTVEQTLASHVEQLGCIIEYGKELLSFKQDEGHVVAEIAAKDGTIETTGVEFLIGADGARGVVRKQLGLTFLGGQGLNSGVQDAFNLGWKVALVAKGLSPLSLLETYTAERLPVIAQMLNLTTDLLNKTFGKARSTVETAFHRGRILFMFGVNYRTSPIVIDEFSAGLPPVPAYGVELSGELVAGDRAPDAPGLSEGNSTVTLFDIYRVTHHTVLVFANNTQRAHEVVEPLLSYSNLARFVVVLPCASVSMEAVKGARVLVDRAGFAYSHYLVKEDTRIIIVRPDGVVGAIVGGLSGTHQYFCLLTGQT
ncbi:FAD/NAD(P)-binding domain-containing protein [Coniophora puteana RWD-64-598 SS2]|uniref:FAD/NAD(P)-binding domain-containing protein n=1 Tax=Coniophora puteana (strain RWD-64-598) TaxID=741705 RepID=A0A5M3N1A0_CONPW|nr:FAD/NAD(P)-binding domain-containing protein [Coniophora puteana RWD-64-598 SS2]EIW84675.1 FAD/NAD(P)-binding domain-containing protein [Coniophora puteana RWD-64-598 SS2]